MATPGKKKRSIHLNQQKILLKLDKNNHPAGSLCWTVPIGEPTLKPAIGMEETMSELELEPYSGFEKRLRYAGLVSSGWLDDAWVKDTLKGLS